MLFGYITAPKNDYKDDVQVSSIPVEAFALERPLEFINKELHVAGALAFLMAFGMYKKSGSNIISTLVSPDAA